MRQAAPSLQEVLRARGVTRRLDSSAQGARPIVSDVSMSVSRGQVIALTGPSGSGKSTLLYLLGALDRPSAGQIWIDGIEVSAMHERQRAVLRNQKLGFVFQFHFLLAEFNVLENVALPALRRGELSTRGAYDHAYDILRKLGMESLYNRLPHQLSGGQQQRVSIARALSNDPMLILADEPTGNLDTKSAGLVFDALTSLARDRGRGVVIITHDASLAARADRQICLRDGAIVDEWARPPILTAT